jgi:hypothetical protein
LILAGPFLRLPGCAGWYREYHDPLRGSTQLRASHRHWFYWRNQIKRNFSYFHDREGYRAALRRRELDGIHLPYLLDLAPRLSPRLLDYFFKLYLTSPAKTTVGRLARLGLAATGLPGLRLALRWQGLRKGKPAHV